MKILYINTEDKQGYDWAVGCVDTIKGWRDIAIGWADSDCSYGLVSALKRYNVKNKDLIDFINDYWEIKIVVYNDKNTKHKHLYQIILNNKY